MKMCRRNFTTPCFSPIPSASFFHDHIDGRFPQREVSTPGVSRPWRGFDFSCGLFQFRRRFASVRDKAAIGLRRKAAELRREGMHPAPVEFGTVSIP